MTWAPRSETIPARRSRKGTRYFSSLGTYENLAEEEKREADTAILLAYRTARTFTEAMHWATEVAPKGDRIARGTFRNRHALLKRKGIIVPAEFKPGAPAVIADLLRELDQAIDARPVREQGEWWRDRAAAAIVDSAYWYAWDVIRNRWPEGLPEPPPRLLGFDRWYVRKALGVDDPEILERVRRRETRVIPPGAQLEWIAMFRGWLLSVKVR